MNTRSRIASILQANSLDTAVTGLPSFDLALLRLNDDLDFELPTRVRLGHVIEKIVSELIKSSTNYKILYENIQLREGKTTIGEIDFIIEDILKHQIIHMELAYKFYLYDPNLSHNPLDNWIGPNRDDSLKEKLVKLKRKQFPLLYHACAQSRFDTIDLTKVSQALCLLTSLFVPYQFKGNLSSFYEKAIQGYYLDFKTFASLDHPTKSYYLPSKKEWGIAPSKNKIWTNYHGVEKQISNYMNGKQSPLCWQKHRDTYIEFFIVWW